MPYFVAAALSLAFVVNVTIGAITKSPPVSNVMEMMLLFGAAIAFSIGILRSEALQKSGDSQDNQTE